MSIHQEVTIKAKPADIYAALTDSEKFAAMTGGRAADISHDEGGKVSLFGGEIEARNVELVPDTRVVQAWRSRSWPDGVYSIVSSALEAEGGGTRLSFDQAGHPGEAEQMLEGGWDQMYWQPMKAMLER